MDRQLSKKQRPLGRLLFLAAAVGFLGLLIVAVMRDPGVSQLQVDSRRMTVSKVEYGEFQEYYPFDGRVEPVTSVYLDVEEGGRVDEIFFEAGQAVKKGDLIIRISNASLQRNSIDTETQLLENLDRLRSTQFNIAQNKLMLREQLLDLDYRIQDLEKKFKRYQMLYQTESTISLEEYESVRDELAYQKKRRELHKERIHQEDLLSQLQLEQANVSIERLTLSLDMLSSIVDSLDVRAPISGYLSSINADLGQSIGRGQRIGQIDLLDEFKLKVEIDEYYINSIQVGTEGHLSINGKERRVQVSKIYPEVENNRFTVDMAFVGGQPPDLKRGQTLTVELTFSETTDSLRVKKGGFYQHTGGRWAYLISEDGLSAKRINIRLGRQNPRFVEVIEGLQDGDRIITSGYEVYNEVDELLFDEPII